MKIIEVKKLLKKKEALTKEQAEIILAELDNYEGIASIDLRGLKKISIPFLITLIGNYKKFTNFERQLYFLNIADPLVALQIDDINQLCQSQQSIDLYNRLITYTTS